MDDFEIPDSGAVYTFGKTRFADNKPSHFFIKNDPIVQVACGDEHTLVLCLNGRVFGFGCNDYGQLGLGHCNVVSRPSCTKALKGLKVKEICCGRSHSVAVTENNQIYTFGNNSDGQLGQGNTIDRDIPTRIEQSPLKSHHKIIQIAAGSAHTALLTDKGRMFVWGSNTESQLGLNLEENIDKVTTPTLLSHPEKIVHISCGYYHTGFITESGHVFLFGENENGKLGLGKIPQKFVTEPTQINVDIKFLKIFCGGHHTFLISTNSNVYGFGLNENGQLGISLDDGNVIDKPTHLKIDQVDLISCGERHSAFLSKNGELYTCGDTKHGKLGIESVSESEFTPQTITCFENLIVTKVACGGCHTIIAVQKPAVQFDGPQVPSSIKLSPISTKIEIPFIEPVQEILLSKEIICNGDAEATSEKEFELLEKECQDVEETVLQNNTLIKQISIESTGTKTIEDLSEMVSSSSDQSEISSKESLGDAQNDDNKDIQLPEEVKKETNRVSKLFKSFKDKIIFTETALVKTNSKVNINGSQKVVNENAVDSNDMACKDKSKACTVL